MATFNSGDVVTALQLVENLGDLINSASSKSLVEYTKPTRVEPLCIVDSRAAMLPYIDSIMHTALNNFTAYYLQAVSLSVNVGSVNVIRLLDKLNPNRGPKSALGGINWSSVLEEQKITLSIEEESPYTQEDLDAFTNRASDTGATVGDARGNSQVGALSADLNLSVGKLIEVNIESGDKRASFPIQVRLITMIMRPDILTDTMTMKTKVDSIKETWHAVRSGQREFIKDIVLADDLIKRHRKNLKNDKTGLYSDAIKRKRTNRVMGFLTANPSVATSSSIFIITEETRMELEGKMRGRLNKFKDRERLLEETLGMIFYVVDPDAEMITVYNQSIDKGSELSVREIQRMGKGGKGPDIVEILNALNSGNAPRF